MATPTVRDGLATLDADAIALRDLLDSTFRGWATARGAEDVRYPPLVRVDDLRRIDYLHNFPQLGLFATGLTEAAAERSGEAGPKTKAPAGPIPAGDLADAGYALPSAACYSAYFDLAGQVLPETRRITTVATCFRREDSYQDLRRLHGFTMREIVCVGERDAVLEHLRLYGGLIQDYLAEAGLPFTRAAATDPFFDPSGARALAQRLFPVKEEFLVGDLAVASVNFHRNFFGERCDIRTADGAPAFTGCVAFGLERWISVLGPGRR